MYFTNRDVYKSKVLLKLHMMKKILFVAAAVASMVFTGCINEDDTYKKLQPVQQGDQHLQLDIQPVFYGDRAGQHRYA